MSWTTADLMAIESAIASGELSVAFADRRVQYRSIDELMKARSMIKESIASSGGVSPSVACTYAQFTKD
jgi:hypothetical protein